MTTDVIDLEQVALEHLAELDKIVAVGNLVTNIAVQGDFTYRDVMALESLIPGIIMDDYPAAGFTPYPSRENTEQVYAQLNVWMDKNGGDQVALEGFLGSLAGVVLATVVAVLVNTGVYFLARYLTGVIFRLVMKWERRNLNANPTQAKKAREEMKKQLGKFQDMGLTPSKQEARQLAELGTAGKKEVVLWAVWNRAKALDTVLDSVFSFTLEAEYGEARGKFKGSEHAFRCPRNIHDYKAGTFENVTDIQHEVFDIVRIKFFRKLLPFMVTPDPMPVTKKYIKYLKEFFAVLYTDRYHGLLRSIRVVDKQLHDEKNIVDSLNALVKDLPKLDEDLLKPEYGGDELAEEIYENYRKDKKGYIDKVMAAGDLLSAGTEEVLESADMKKVLETLHTMETQMKTSKEAGISKEFQEALKALNDVILVSYQLAVRLSMTLYNHAQSISTLVSRTDVVYGGIKRIRANEKLIEYVQQNFRELTINIQGAPMDKVTKRIKELVGADDTDTFDEKSLGFAI